MSGQGKSRAVNVGEFIADAWRNVMRNKIMSTASVFVLSSCLVLFGAFTFLIKNIDYNLENLNLLNEMTVFAEYDLDSESVEEIFAKIKQLDGVEDAVFVSKLTGFEQMRDTYSDYADVFEDMSENGENPLADSFIVTYTNAEAANELQFELSSIPGVMKVTNRADYALKIDNAKNAVSVVFVWFFALLFFVSVFVVFSTIKLALQARRAEIDVMRYMGATKSFIIMPFITEGAMIGLASSVIAYAVTAWICRALVASSAESLSFIKLLPFGEVRGVLIAAFLAVGVLTAVAASAFSLRKNLKN